MPLKQISVEEDKAAVNNRVAACIMKEPELY